MREEYFLMEDEAMARRARWSEVSPVVEDAALRCCRGPYQRNLVLGFESLSGSTLKGKASRYASHYHRSAGSLLRRMRGAGLHVSVRTAEHGARVLVIRPDFIGDGI